MKRDNKKRRDIFIHESSYVDESVKIGKGTKVWHFAHIAKRAKIGKNCKIGQNVFIGEDSKVGNNVKIQNNVSIYTGITLEDSVFCGPSMVFTNVKKPRSLYPVNKKYDKTLVRKGATISANATIICGITIGRCAFIGAGSVVTRDVPDFALVYGNPAKLKGWICECGKTIIVSKKSKKYICKDCNKGFKE